MVFVLLILVLWCRFSTPAADWYAQHLYPGISRVLTWLASPFGFSLTEIVIALAAVALIIRVIRIFRDRQHWKKRLWRAVRLLLWAYVWFYAAWGINYSRSSLYSRLGATPMPYEEEEFREFLAVFSRELNASWCPQDILMTVDPKEYGKAIKSWYDALPEESGLCKPCRWQNPKRTVFNPLYSAVGVLGFIGPVFDEMHLNRDITPLEYPFVYVHEYSHVLGVTNEAEANYWAFEATRTSHLQPVRYSGWYMLLHFCWNNIHSLLGDEEFHAWADTLRPEILEDMQRTKDYWQDKRLVGLQKIQKRFYDLFLRSNGIADGTKNYSQVLRMVLTFSDLHGDACPGDETDESHGEER